MQFGLKKTVVEKVRSVLSDFEPIEEAILYGSRAMGTHRNGSDIDLTLKVRDEVPTSLLGDVIEAIDRLDLIYSFDISIYSQIKNENLLSHIDRVGVLFYSASKNES